MEAWISQRDEIRAALDAVDAGYARLRAACSDSVGNAFRVEVAERLETQHRINRGQMYRFFGELIEPPDGPDDPDLPAGTVISKLLWQRLRITTGEVQRRMPHRRPHPSAPHPDRPATAARTAPAWPPPSRTARSATTTSPRSASALDVLPSAVPEHKKDVSERILVRHATESGRHFVKHIGRGIADHLNPDGLFDENDRARRRGNLLRKAPTA